VPKRLRPERGAGVPNAAAALGWPAGGDRRAAAAPSESERGWDPASKRKRLASAPILLACRAVRAQYALPHGGRQFAKRRLIRGGRPGFLTAHNRSQRCGSTCYTPQQSRSGVITIVPASISDLQQRLADQHYVADRGLAVPLYLALRLERPLFLEGEAGVGKTALAGAVAAALGTDLIRLQCYEGLDVGHALYEWDYARQLLELRILDATHTLTRESAHRELYSDAFLIKRPLLQAIDPQRQRPAVLLIDEIDRADEEFEGFLLELLAEFQITIPELGTVRAARRPLVILTSNRTREVHDALKRRCLYQWIGYPSFEKEVAIVRERAPAASTRLAERVTAMVQEMRTTDLYKTPGVSETIDWVTALVALDRDTLDADTVEETLGVVLKAKEDVEALRGRRAAELLDRAIARTA
jgi:MoxR-like ATPase